MYKRTSRRFFAFAVAIALILSSLLSGIGEGGSTAYATTYGMSLFATDSGGTGYQMVGNYLKVANDQFTACSSVAVPYGLTAFYPSDSEAMTNIYNPDTDAFSYENYRVRISAEGGTACKTFTFQDLGFSAYSDPGAFTFGTFSIAFYDAFGAPIGSAENLAGGSGIEIPQNGIIKLSAIYSHGAWDVDGVAAIELNFSVRLNGAPAGAANIAFETIDITDVSASLAPTVTGVSPSSGPTAGGTSVSITGTNFTGVYDVTFGSTPATYMFVSPTQITATAPAGAAGTAHVTVTTAVGTSATSAADQFTYVPAPTVTGISPNSGPATGGTVVTITGTNFTGATAVSFGGTPATGFTVNASSQITATAPAGTGTKHVTVTTVGGTSATGAANEYTYVPAPTVTGISPSNGPNSGGTTVTITGTNFSGATSVAFGATPAASFTVDSATQITAVAPAGIGTSNVRVITTGGTSAISAASQFTYVPAPTVTGISPVTGPTAGGTSVTITGTNFTGTTAVTFGGTPVTGYTVNSSTQITATSPAGAAGPAHVTVTTAGGTSATSAADQYTYAAVPMVTGITPSTGPTGGGTSVVITGTDFTEATAVKFGTTNAASYTVNSATQITAITPAGTGIVDVKVTTAGGTSAAGVLFAYAAPVVTMINPSSGPASGGTSVVITGTDFTAATAVKFGSTNATSYTVNSATQITATAPAGTGTVGITVTTPSGTNTPTVAFTYVAGPTVNSISPNIGPVVGGTSVTITGTNFTGTTAVAFGGTPATSFTFVSPTQITATAPAGTGTAHVTVTTAGGTSATSAADQFTYAAVPMVTGITPGTGPTGGGTSIVITGNNFTGATGAEAVKFGTINAASYWVDSATQITAITPAGTGIVDVKVTTAGGTSSAGIAFAYAAPVVTMVNPSSGPASGGTSVVITGTDFTEATAVKFGSTNAMGYTVNSATQITAIAPAGTGTVSITVTTPSGTNTPTVAFTYVAAPTVSSISPNSGSTAGGTSVIITGTNFTGATAVTFGGTPASGYTVNSSTQITATAPAGVGTVDITVTTAGGTSATSAADQYTYVGAPTISGVSPNSGTTAGGTSVTITGANFMGAVAVSFGGTPATSFTVNSNTQITATVPAGTGIVNVRVTTAGGTSATSAANQYTYLTPPSVTTSPGNATVNEGNNTSFTVAAEGAGLIYQWQINTGSGFANISNGGIYSGTQAATLTITGATTGMNGFLYRVVVSGTLPPPATSSSAMLTVHPKLTLSGNAGIGGVVLSYTDGTPKTVTADSAGVYSFTVPYNWSGTVTPSKTGYSFAAGSRTYTAITTDQSAQNYTATPLTYTLTYDYQGATGGNTVPSKFVAYNAAVGTLPTPTKTGYAFGGWYTALNGTGLNYTSATIYSNAGGITLYAKWIIASGGFVPLPPPVLQPLTLSVTAASNGATTSSAPLPGTYNPQTRTVSATVGTTYAQTMIDEALAAKAQGKKSVSTVNFGTVGNATTYGASFDRNQFRQLAASKTTLQMVTGIGSVTLSSTQLSSISRAAPTGNISMSLEKVGRETLPLALQAKVKDAPLYRFGITVGNTGLSRISGSVKITIPYTPQIGTRPRTVKIYYIDSKNVLRSVTGKYDAKTGMITFSLTRF